MSVLSGALNGQPSTRDALRMAQELGCTIRERSGNRSEVSVMHERWSRPINVIVRAKNSPRLLSVALRRLLLDRDEARIVDVEMVKDVVNDHETWAVPEPQMLEVDEASIERQSPAVVGEERVSLEDAAALVERPVGTVRQWIVQEKLDVGYDPKTHTIACSGLDILDHLSRTRRRQNYGEGAKFFPPKPVQLSLPNEVIPMNTPAPTNPKPNAAPFALTAEDRALAMALGMTDDAFVRWCVDQTAKRMREKLRAMLTEAA